MNYFRQSLNGPKALQAVVLGSYAVTARELYGFERTHLTVLLLLMIGVALDAIVGRIWFKGWRFSPTSLVIPFATSILIDSPHLWVYLAALVFAILSKALIRIDGRHVFNPANFGVVVMLVFASDRMTGIPSLFGSHVGASVVFFIIGTFVSVYAKTWRVSVLWIALFLFFAFVRSELSGVPFQMLLYPMLGPTFILFTFHMITDPATVPRKFWHQALFVFVVASVDAYFRFNSRPYGNFYGLFLATALIPFMRQALEPRLERRRQVLGFYAGSMASIALALPVYLAEQERLSADPIFHIHLRDSRDTTPQNLFAERGDLLGFRFTHQDPIVDPRLQAKLRIQYVAPGVAIADFNDDGWMDILVVNGRSRDSKNALFINKAGNGFIDKAEEWGIADIPTDLIPQSANVFDFNGDGRPDVFIAGPGCSRLYKNMGTSFKDATANSGLTDCANSIAAVPYDYDGDGRLDLYVMRFFSSKLNLFNVGEHYSDFAPDRWIAPTNGGENTLYRNLGNDRFARVPAGVFSEQADWTWDAGFADLDTDGKMELVVGNDWGQDRYYRIDSGKFVDVTESLAHPDGRSGMTVSFGFWKSQFPSVFITNAYAESFTQRGNFLWEYSPEERRLRSYENHRASDNCGWSWGAYFGDFDLDGETDLYVANGMITRKKIETTTEQPADAVVTPVRDTNFFKLAQTKTIPPEWVSQTGASPFDVINLNQSFSGNQRDCLFMRNPQTEQYENRSLAEPAIDFWDGRAVAAIDYDNDGDLDLVVTTQGEASKFLVNQTPVNERHWVGLQLKVPATEQVGAVFKFTQGNAVYYRWGAAGKSGFLAYSDPRIHLGLKSNAPVSLDITWGSGRTTRVEQLALNRYQTIQ